MIAELLVDDAEAVLDAASDVGEVTEECQLYIVAGPGRQVVKVRRVLTDEGQSVDEDQNGDVGEDED